MRRLSISFSIFSLFVLAACGGPSTSTQSGSLSCTASGTPATLPVPLSSSVTLSNLTVSVLNGTNASGSYTIAVSGLTSVTSTSSTYTFTTSELVNTDASGNITNTVTVTDPSTNASAVCSISTGSSTTGSFSVTQQVISSTQVELTASGASGATSYNYALQSTYSGVSIAMVSGSATQAVVTGSSGQTVNVIVTANTGASTTLAVTIGSGSSSGGTVNIVISSSAVSYNNVVPRGTNVTLSASATGMTSPTFYWFYWNGTQWVQSLANSTVYSFTSYNSGIATIAVVAVDGATQAQYYTQTSVQFY